MNDFCSARKSGLDFLYFVLIFCYFSNQDVTQCYKLTITMHAVAIISDAQDRSFCIMIFNYTHPAVSAYTIHG